MAKLPELGITFESRSSGTLAYSSQHQLSTTWPFYCR